MKIAVNVVLILVASVAADTQRTDKEASTESALVAWGGGAIALPGKEESPPHNSLELVECAADLGFSAIELDIRMSGDGVPMLARSAAINDLHSSVLKRGTRGWWRGKAIAYATLEEALRMSSRPKIIVVDCRTRVRDADFLARAMWRANADPTEVIFTTYDMRTAKAYMSAIPGSRVFLKAYHKPAFDWFNWIERAADAGLSGVMFEVRDLLSSRSIGNIVRMAHGRGLETMSFVHVRHYGRARMDDQVSAGVDYILTTSRYDNNSRSCMLPEKPAG